MATWSSCAQLPDSTHETRQLLHVATVTEQGSFGCRMSMSILSVDILSVDILSVDILGVNIL